MQYTSSLYGVTVNTDIAFPLSLPLTGLSRYTLYLSKKTFSFNSQALTCGSKLYRAHGRNVYLYSDREFLSSSKEGQPWCYEVEGVCRFFWKGKENSIYYDFIGEENTSLLSFWFIHLMLPFFFAIEEKYEMFHGGSVMVDGCAIMFCAPSMGGKSTMTDYFLKQGHPLISDDKIPLWIEQEHFMLTGSHPYHRPYRKFEELGYLVSSFVNSAVSLQAMYILERSEASSSVIIEEVRGFNKFQEILPHYLFPFPFQQKKRMVYLAKLVDNIRVFKVFRPWDIDRIDEVYSAIKAHTLMLKTTNDYNFSS